MRQRCSIAGAPPGATGKTPAGGSARPVGRVSSSPRHAEDGKKGLTHRPSGKAPAAVAHTLYISPFEGIAVDMIARIPGNAGSARWGCRSKSRPASGDKQGLSRPAAASGVNPRIFC